MRTQRKWSWKRKKCETQIRKMHRIIIVIYKKTTNTIWNAFYTGRWIQWGGGNSLFLRYVRVINDEFFKWNPTGKRENFGGLQKQNGSDREWRYGRFGYDREEKPYNSNRKITRTRKRNDRVIYRNNIETIVWIKTLVVYNNSVFARMITR